MKSPWKLQPLEKVKIVCCDLPYTNTGIGIDARDHEKLFTAFNQLTRDGAIPPDGTGLGLAISGQLVKLMGGDIGVDSEPDIGSCFLVRNPPCSMVAPTMQRQLKPGPATDRIAHG